jgi:GNAT superfamily N-acetyltransferase
VARAWLAFVSGKAVQTIIERYSTTLHSASDFSCGNASLDEYIRVHQERDENDHTAVTFVLLDKEAVSSPKQILGYFTLSSFALPRQQARRRDRDKHLGRYDPVPAVLLGRLAIDGRFQGQGLGSAIILASLTKVLRIREDIGISVVMVHAIDEAAAAFYQHQGFTQFRDEPFHFYYPLAKIAAGLDQ